MLAATLSAALLVVAARAVMPEGGGSVYFTAPSTYRFVAGAQDPTAAAWGYYKDMTLAPSGFGQLSVSTNGALPAAAQMFAAGFLEGALTQERIYSHTQNAMAWIESQFKGGAIPANVQAFFVTQDAWARAQVASNNSDHWVAMGGILSQFDGMVAGYAATAPANQTLSLFQLQSVNAIGDYLDLIVALSPADAPDYDAMNDTELMAAVRKNNHCSALVKVNGDLSELYFAHVAWFIFQSMTRIFKHYNFALNQAAVAGRQMSFSSYPAYLSSLDDWYAVWSSGLAVLETTNNVFNKTLYQAVAPQSLFAWHRVRLANLLAHSPPEWAAVFSQYNSGTYNNQYPVINVGAFTPGKALPPDLLWVVEQVPGLVVAGGATELLALGHFPSYHVPYWRGAFFPSSQNLSRYPPSRKHTRASPPPTPQRSTTSLATRSRLRAARPRATAPWASSAAWTGSWRRAPRSSGATPARWTPWTPSCRSCAATRTRRTPTQRARPGTPSAAAATWLARPMGAWTARRQWRACGRARPPLP